MPTIGLEHLDLYYETTGTGPPVILIPGWTLNTRFWDGVTEGLSGAFRVIRYDVRGAGQSSSDPILEYSRMADVEDLAGLLDHLHLGRVHLVGHSKGARIACIFSMLHPERVLSLTAIGSAEPHGTLGEERAFRPIAQAWVQRARDKAHDEGSAAAVLYLAEGRLFGKLRTSVEGVRRLHLAMQGYQAADLLSTLPRRDADTGKLVSNLTMPVQFVVGDEDPFLKECEYAHRAVAGSELVVLKGAGHMVPLEQPDLIAGQIFQFITSLSPGQGLG